jgi:hypothetical protein
MNNQDPWVDDLLNERDQTQAALVVTAVGMIVSAFVAFGLAALIYKFEAARTISVGMLCGLTTSAVLRKFFNF